MAKISESDLAQARVAVGALMEELGVIAHLYAVEPRQGIWAVIVECATAPFQKTNGRPLPTP